MGHIGHEEAKLNRRRRGRRREGEERMEGYSGEQRGLRPREEMRRAEENMAEEKKKSLD